MNDYSTKMSSMASPIYNFYTTKNVCDSKNDESGDKWAAIQIPYFRIAATACQTNGLLPSVH